MHHAFTFISTCSSCLQYLQRRPICQNESDHRQYNFRKDSSQLLKTENLRRRCFACHRGKESCTCKSPSIYYYYDYRSRNFLCLCIAQPNGQKIRDVSPFRAVISSPRPPQTRNTGEPTREAKCYIWMRRCQRLVPLEAERGGGRRESQVGGMDVGYLRTPQFLPMLELIRRAVLMVGHLVTLGRP